MDDDLRWLTEWYLSQCGDDWEHSFGIKIETLDNPGWTLRIELTDTELEDRPFETVRHGEPAQDLEEWTRTGSWWIARLEDKMFYAACGPLDLPAVISIFRVWAEVPQKAAH